MAVRQRLQNLLRDQQFTGSIVVESLPIPASTTRVVRPCHPLALAARAAAVLPPVPAAARRGAGSVFPPPPPRWRRRRGPKPEDCAVFHCRGCWTVLGDSLHLCAQEEKWLGLLVCFKVADNVAWEDSLVVGLKGALLGCAYNAISCRSCGLSVGFILHSASRDLAYLRGFFCFFKKSIICYLLQNQTIIEASKVNFPSVTLMGQLRELKVKLVHAHHRLEYVMKQLEEQTK